ncbi:MAG: hypothetical protein ACPLW8_06845 [Candidatus Bathyarchaeales archaeon]
MTNKDEFLIQILLKELELCQRNRDHYDTLEWQIGSLFIGFSLAAFWFAMQSHSFIDVSALAFFSIATLLTWTFALHHRGAFYSKVSLETARKLEAKILELAKVHITSELLLHTKIDAEDRKPMKKKGWHLKARTGIWLFNGILIVAWCLIIITRLPISPFN